MQRSKHERGPAGGPPRGGAQTTARLVAALLCLPLLFATSCSDDTAGQDSVAPAPSSAGTGPSGTATSEGPSLLTQPTLPAAAEETNLDGAKAYVEHWVAALNNASAVGKTDYLRSLAAAECATCAKLAAGIDALYASGGKLVSNGWKVIKIAGPADDATTSGPKATLTLSVLRQPEAVYQDTQSEPKVFRGGEETYQVTVVVAQGAWRVEQVSPVGGTS